MDDHESAKDTPEALEAPAGAVDRFAYCGIAVYCAVNIAWFVWAFSGAGFGIFTTQWIIGGAFPAAGMLALIVFQCSSAKSRFSNAAATWSVVTIAAWFLAVHSFVSAAAWGV